MTARTQKRAETPSLASNASGNSSTKSLTTVINIRNAPEGWRDDSQYVYIGRQNNWYKLPASDWCNPFRITRFRSRENVLAYFALYLHNERPDLMARIGELKGKTLVCYCAPEKCHGHILAELAEGGAK